MIVCLIMSGILLKAMDGSPNSQAKDGSRGHSIVNFRLYP